MRWGFDDEWRHARDRIAVDHFARRNWLRMPQRGSRLYDHEHDDENDDENDDNHVDRLAECGSRGINHDAGEETEARREWQASS
ncbi:MAG: hypothetical protein JRJ24_10330 [Deltaproteobacteria bacterium]|nr:hypothetical protein [Deltaproteobacteria bacterium]